MSPTLALVTAIAAMVALTLVVGVRLCVERWREMHQRRIPPQAVATSRQAAEQLHAVQAADNFRNLFEMPVLFYTLCTLALALRAESAWLAAGCWLYVLLRCVHSAIHCTSNQVIYRFSVFAASVLVLALLWVGMVVELAFVSKA
ncbi:MAG: MAPEG family protein [Burkholderiaceae bacterium]